MLRYLIATAFVALPLPAVAQTSVQLSTMINDEEGEYVVDGGGLSLYTFKADTQGTDSSPAASACNDDACTGTWPPLIGEGAPVVEGNVNASLLGTLQRDDGTVQVTYNGWPLYYYYEDAVNGDILGDDIESFGEDWYLIGPNGYRPGKGPED